MNYWAKEFVSASFYDGDGAKFISLKSFIFQKYCRLTGSLIKRPNEAVLWPNIKPTIRFVNKFLAFNLHMKKIYRAHPSLKGTEVFKCLKINHWLIDFYMNSRNANSFNCQKHYIATNFAILELILVGWTTQNF